VNCTAVNCVRWIAGEPISASILDFSCKFVEIRVHCLYICKLVENWHAIANLFFKTFLNGFFFVDETKWHPDEKKNKSEIGCFYVTTVLFLSKKKNTIDCELRHAVELMHAIINFNTFCNSLRFFFVSCSQCLKIYI
jgi:hypothetical protein